jgi:hypothetical protein
MPYKSITRPCAYCSKDFTGPSDHKFCGRSCATAARNTKHGLSHIPEHAVWCSMRQRCLNPNDESYKRWYGSKGITICERWSDFGNFIADMGRRPTPEHTIERRDGTKGYSPDNCKWATPTEQARNTCTNHTLTLNGITRCISEWAELLGLDYETLRCRIVDSHWPVDKALLTPVRPSILNYSKRGA